MRSRIKHFIFIVLLYVVSYFFADVLATLILIAMRSVSGGGNYQSLRAIATYIYRAIFFILPLPFIYFIKARNKDERSLYRAYVCENGYSVKQELGNLIRNEWIWAEIILVSAMTLLYFLNFYLFTWPLWNIPVFIAFEIASTLLIHRAWKKDIKAL